MSDIQNKIIEWFSNNTRISPENITSKLEVNYFNEGWIDSFQFISFITDMEKLFEIRFNNDEFQDRRFSTINGLVEIVKDKINK